jgi:uncharacterized protein (UPF0276 family)
MQNIDSTVLGRVDALVKRCEEIAVVNELAWRHADRLRRDLLELRADLAATAESALPSSSTITPAMLGAVNRP